MYGINVTNSLIFIVFLAFLQGVDTMIYERMDDVELNLYKKVTNDHLENFGVDGLQTLCLAYHELDVQLYETWNEKFIQVKLALRNMEKKLDEVNNFSQ